MSGIQPLRGLVFLIPSLLVLSASAIGDQIPVAVSPGGGARAVAETSSCPTFSWSAVDGARGYELAVLEVEGTSSQDQVSSVTMDAAEPVLRIDIPGRALTWTPSRTQCFGGVGLYAWAIRAESKVGDGPWSDVQLFRVATAPTQEEVEEALKVLRRFQATRDSGEESVESVSQPPVDPGSALLEQEQETDNISSRAVTTPPGFSLNLSGSLNLGGFFFANGNVFLHHENANLGLGFSAVANTTVPIGRRNVAVGNEALRDNSEGESNTAVGHFTLVTNSSGSFNVAAGHLALHLNTTGSRNTGIGASALFLNRDVSDNTAVGHDALKNISTGEGSNTAVGSGALSANTQGTGNTAVGKDALVNNTGTNNIALGKDAGINAATGFNNIFIGNDGEAADNGVIRIGQDLQSETYIEGVSGVPIAGGSTVVIGTNERLGTTGSSLRFKTDIHDLGSVSERIFDLRPVRFRYRAFISHDQQGTSLQYGLIAEEVAEVLPELVTSDAEGRPVSVRYDLLTPLLVNEMQRQQQLIDDQRNEMERLRKRLQRLERRKQRSRRER